MPCETLNRQGQTPAQRETEVQAALKSLEDQLDSRMVQVKIGPQGAIMFDGWENRQGVTDVCAVRRLESEGSWEWRQALARAEATSGRKLNINAVNSGMHSHDGHTWGSH